MMKPAIALALLLAASSIAAKPLSYDFIEAGYFAGDFSMEGFSVDFDGFTVRGSKELGNNWLLLGNFTRMSTDTVSGTEFFFDTEIAYQFDLDGDFTQIGAGYVFEASPGAHFIFSAGYLRSTAELNFRYSGGGMVEAGTESFSDSGYFLGLGLRTMFTDALEGEVSIEHLDAGESTRNLRVSLRYHFSEQFSASGEWLDFDGDDAVGASVRFAF